MLIQRKILNDIKIPIQGGLDPKILLTDKEKLKKKQRNI
jgi:uroporphyrinogen decarboxylase